MLREFIPFLFSRNQTKEFIMARYNWIAIVFFCSFGPAWADNQELGTRVLVQPDGTRFSVREYMDEFGHYLLADAGYVIQDETTGYYYYARYDNTGRATPSTLLVGRDDAPSEVAQLAWENGRALMGMAWRSHGVGSFAGAAGKSSAITFPEELLVLLVEFSDVKHRNPDPDDWPITDISLLGSNDCYLSEDGCVGVTYSKYTVDNFEDMLFGDNYTRSPDDKDDAPSTVYGSMRQYYEDMSRETYTIEGRVVNQVQEDDPDFPIWVTLGGEKNYYHRKDEGDPSGIRAKTRFRDAVLAAAASQQGFNTIPSETRPLCIIYAGNRYQNGGGLHPHYAPSDNIYVMHERTASPYGVEVNSAKFSHIGTHCHEFGHVLGLGDYYHTYRNYRRWGLMAQGSHRGANPSPLSPHLRSLLGWLTPTEVEGFMEGEELSYSSDQDDVYRIQSSSDPDDFFLIENRQPDKRWNEDLPGGLLIWHIKDEDIEHDWIDLIEADNLPNSYAGDPFPGETENRNLTDFTTPSSRQFAYEGLSLDDEPHDEPPLRDNSNVLVTNISNSGTEMTADLSPFWVGTITENTNQPWSGTVRIGGDVIVPAGVILEIEANTEIQFIADTDAAESGTEKDLSELIVQGTLTASAGGIIFRSTHDAPDDADWYGIRVLPGGEANLSNASLHDGVLCVSKEGGKLTLNNTSFDNCGMLRLRIEGDSIVKVKETYNFNARYTAKNAVGDVEWSLVDENDVDAFELTGEGVLSFKEPLPDFEAINDPDNPDDPTYDVTIQAEDSQSAAVAELRVTVTVENVDEEGMLTVKPTMLREDGSLSPPRVGEELTATLEDLDGVLPLTTDWAWWAGNAVVQWEFPDPDGEVKVTESGGVTDRYTPQPEDVGRALRVVVSYADGHGEDKEMSVTTAPVEGDPVLELDGPESLTFVEHGTFVDEAGEGMVPTYTVSGVDGAVTWSLEGDDAAAFDLETDSGGGRSLSFLSPPNYEMPTDTDEGGTNTYHVTVVATPTEGAPSSSEQDSQDSQDPFANLFAMFQGLSNEDVSAQASSSSLTQAVVVTVEDGDDPGVVELPEGAPRVGTALTARLVDEDRILPGTAQWTWSGQASEPGRDHEGASESGYEPMGEDVGRRLQVRVDYEDVWSSQTVTSDPTEPVQPAGEVTLTPSEPRVGQPVTARLSCPDEPVTGAAWTWERQRQGSADDEWDLIGSSVSSASDVADPDLAAMLGSFNWGWAEVSSYEPTVADTGWVLQARVRWAGQEVSSPDSAPVRAGVPDRPRSLEGKGADGDDGSGAVVLTWKTPFDNGSPITGYEYQYRLFGSTAWKKSWTALDGSTQATTSHTVDSLALGEMHTFEVRAISDTDEAGSKGNRRGRMLKPRRRTPRR